MSNDLSKVCSCVEGQPVLAPSSKLVRRSYIEIKIKYHFITIHFIFVTLFYV
jgi:hypothetical protein